MKTTKTKKRNGWRTGIPSDGHTILLDHHDRAFAVNETTPLRFEIIPLPNPPAIRRRPATKRRSKPE